MITIDGYVQGVLVVAYCLMVIGVAYLAGALIGKKYVYYVNMKRENRDANKWVEYCKKELDQLTLNENRRKLFNNGNPNNIERPVSAEPE